MFRRAQPNQRAGNTQRIVDDLRAKKDDVTQEPAVEKAQHLRDLVDSSKAEAKTYGKLTGRTKNRESMNRVEQSMTNYANELTSPNGPTADSRNAMYNAVRDAKAHYSKKQGAHPKRAVIESLSEAIELLAPLPVHIWEKKLVKALDTEDDGYGSRDRSVYEALSELPQYLSRGDDPGAAMAARALLNNFAGICSGILPHNADRTLETLVQDVGRKAPEPGDCRELKQALWILLRHYHGSDNERILSVKTASLNLDANTLIELEERLPDLVKKSSAIQKERKLNQPIDRSNSKQAKSARK